MSAVVADQSTLDTWKGHAQNSTENVGRIWTDKTVQTENITLSPSNVTVNKADGADFLVGLSALSSLFQPDFRFWQAIGYRACYGRVLFYAPDGFRRVLR